MVSFPDDPNGSGDGCDVEFETGTLVDLLREGAWQLLESDQSVTSGLYTDSYELEPGSCRPGVVQVQNTPITKGRGDARLAEIDDVNVYVDDVEREIWHIEPTLGLIFLEKGVETGAEVTVEYHHTHHPTLPFASFNHPGYTFNKFGGETSSPNKFAFNAVFMPGRSQQPLQREYTYTAYHHPYTSTFNDPTSLLFNEHPHKPFIPRFGRDLESLLIRFDGNDFPAGDWERTGPDPGPVAEFEDGLFIIDDQSEEDDTVNGQPLFYRYHFDTTFEHVVTLNFRLQSFEYSLKGQFTGIAAGYAGEQNLHLLGLLEKDDFRFAGLLSKGGDESKWTSYRGLTSTVIDESELEFRSRPPFFEDDRILVGGDVFTVTNIEQDGSFFSVTVDGAIDIPHFDTQQDAIDAVADGTLDLNGNSAKTGKGYLYTVDDDDEIQVFPELDHEILTSYRLLKTEDGNVRAFSRGSTVPFTTISEEDLPDTNEPFEMLESNEMFFGSLSRQSTSRSGWDFLRLALLPTFASETTSDVRVRYNAEELPEETPEKPWIRFDDKGYAKIVDDDRLLIEQAGETERGIYAYGRIEPFIEPSNDVNLRARVRSDAFPHNTSPATITIADRKREVTLGLFAQTTIGDTMFFDETDYAVYKATGGVAPADGDALDIAVKGTFVSGDDSGILFGITGDGEYITGSGDITTPDGQSFSTDGTLIPLEDVDPEDDLPNFKLSYTGLQPFEKEDWIQQLDPAIESRFIDRFHRINKPDGVTGTVYRETDTEYDDIFFRNYVFSARMRLNRWESNSLNENSLPVSFGFNDRVHQVFFTFRYQGSTPSIVVANEQGDVLLDGGDPIGFDYDWDDGKFHTYKVVRNGSVILFFVDGLFQKTFDVDDFLVNSTGRDDGYFTVDMAYEELSIDIDYIFAHSTLYGPRQVGVFRGGPLHDPNSYDLVGAEWLGQMLDIEISRDPQGRTEVFLGGDEDPAEDGNTKLSYQYTELPTRLDRDEVNTKLGYVMFGNGDPGSFSETIWDHVKYDIPNIREQTRTLPNSVFNAGWPTTSPEPVYDETVEEMVLKTNAVDRIFLSPKGLKARRVISVKNVQTNEYLDFDFERETNEIHLIDEVKKRRTEVVVRFLHDDPFGRKYIEEQTAIQRLNEDIPPWPLSQQAKLEMATAAIDTLVDDDPTFDDYDITFDDGKMRVGFRIDDSSIFDDLKLKDVEIKGVRNRLAPASDTKGWKSIEFDVYDENGVVKAPFNDEYKIGEGFSGFRYRKRFILDSVGHILDTVGSVLDGTEFGDVQVHILWELEEDVDPAEDELTEAIITYIDGFILDSVDSQLDGDPENPFPFTDESQLPNDGSVNFEDFRRFLDRYIEHEVDLFSSNNFE